jgi:hypothetical protein
MWALFVVVVSTPPNPLKFELPVGTVKLSGPEVPSAMVERSRFAYAHTRGPLGAALDQSQVYGRPTATYIRIFRRRWISEGIPKVESLEFRPARLQYPARGVYEQVKKPLMLAFRVA